MKPDFDTMSKSELRSYVLANRDDDEAFYKLVDRLNADNKDAVRYPCPKTPEDWNQIPNIIEQHLKTLGK